MSNSPAKMSDSDTSDPGSPRVKSELELLREKNIRERDAYIASLMSDPDFAEVMGSINSGNKQEKKLRVRKSGGNLDPTYRSHLFIPLERRKSARLENKSPIFTKDDLIDESTFKRKRYDNDDEYSDLENIVYQPRKSRRSIKRNVPYSPLIPIQDVTEDMINNIARKVSVKTYSDAGTSCHQCRQKTVDQKTCCRSNNCIGVRGQFCGVCLENRYGEDAAVALKDPNWQCPVCRGICNCSFCRAKAGKRPTGILTPQALQAGHKSVKDFLESLKGEGDYAHQDNIWQTFKNPKNLLGFSQDLSTACMGGGIERKLYDSNMSSEKMIMYCQQKEEKLKLLVEEHSKLYDFLGFENDEEHDDMHNTHALKYIENFLCKKQKEMELLEESLKKD